MYLLDTDALTLVFAGHPRVGERRATVPSSEIAISIVTRIEVLRGRFDFVFKAADADELLRAQDLLTRTEQRLAEIETIWPFDAASAAQFDRLRAERKLRKIGRGDLLIASIALARRATLVTRNLRDFRQVSGLVLDNWAD
jgi:tRNA(fMet)-specific endonuclease VapC